MQVNLEMLAYLRRFIGKTIVVKFGSQMAAAAEQFQTTAHVALASALGIKIVLVHGGDTFDLRMWPSLEENLESFFWPGIDPERISHSCGLGNIPLVHCEGDPAATDNVVVDLASTLMAHNLAVAKIMFLTLEPGVLDGDDNVIRHMDLAQARSLLASNAIKNGMQNKLACAVRAIDEAGVDRVHIINGAMVGSFLDELLSARGVGTMIYGSKPYIEVRPACASDVGSVWQLIRSHCQHWGRMISYQELWDKRHCLRVGTLDGHVHACALVERLPGSRVLKLSYVSVSEPYEDRDSLPRLLEHIIETEGGECGWVLFPKSSFVSFPGLSTEYLPTNLWKSAEPCVFPDIGVSLGDHGLLAESEIIYAPIRGR